MGKRSSARTLGICNRQIAKKIIKNGYPLGHVLLSIPQFPALKPTTGSHVHSEHHAAVSGIVPIQKKKKTHMLFKTPENADAESTCLRTQLQHIQIFRSGLKR